MADQPHILVLTPFSPYPASDGARLRMHQAIDSLAGVAQITLVTFVESTKDNDDAQYTVMCSLYGLKEVIKIERPRKSFLVRFIAGLLTLRRTADFSYYSRNVDKRLDQMFTHHSFDMLLILGASTLFSYAVQRGHAKLCVDMCDDNLLSLTRISSIQKCLFRRLYFRTQKILFGWTLERRSKYIDDFIFISKNDASCVSNLNRTNYRVIPNYVDNTFFQTSKSINSMDEKVLLFVGDLTSGENIDAVKYFAREIMPRVSSEYESILFRVVGKGGEKLEISNARGKIELVGYADDLIAEYKSCAVFVCPLRSGAGIKNKVLESMACGCSVVTTSIGAESIGCTHGKEILIADTADEFARAILDLLHNPSAYRKLGNRAQRLVKTRFSQEKISELWRQLVLN